ncbi:hypothetical protein Q2E61_01535 [Microbulbifer thermotolerans]|uniref:hypothetical protein n=1 Tax=Microbulbifer thermotolerans TaxID=252514 RepID=UPI0026734816|nr:hypothetical protein [Microbulbifer thermotolerans]WKT60910.1 hypothetical protein Q2E61_01535 [Microbulbifer thermotolerans]
MLHKLHRASALLISLYILVHLANHLLALGGVEEHIAFMDSYRNIYRNALVEPLLLACVLFQVGSGMTFIIRRIGQRRGFFDRAQAVSGAYLAFFFLFHIGAILYGRTVQGVDTNFFFAAAGLQPGAYPAFFMPYYTLAVVAYFTHLACALRWLLRRRFTPRVLDRAAAGAMVLGLLLAVTVVATFSGAFYPVEIPEEYCLGDC